MNRKIETLTIPIVVGQSSTVFDYGRYSPPQEPLWLQFIGAFVGTYIVESSIDGTTWYALNGSLVSDLTSAATPPTSVTADGLFAYFTVLQTRIRCTAYTSGTPEVMISYADDTPSQ